MRIARSREATNSYLTQRMRETPRGLLPFQIQQLTEIGPKSTSGKKSNVCYLSIDLSIVQLSFSQSTAKPTSRFNVTSSSLMVDSGQLGLARYLATENQAH